VIFDYARNRLFLEPNDSYGKLQPVNRTGCAVGYKNQKFEVISVQPDSPAGKAGIQLGDVIIQVDRIKGDALTIDVIKEYFGKNPGTKLKLRVLRGDKKMTKRIVLKEIF
jgi:C-terminal processing protease CtpA/Prc